MSARTALLIAAAGALLLQHLPQALAQSAYPTKPVRMIVPVAPGGGADITARALAQKLTETWGQQVIIDNRPGAGGIVGLDIGARAAPDGYTIVQASIGPLAVNPSLHSKLPYNSIRDFDPVTRAVSALNVLVVHPSQPVKSVKDLIAHAKANPGKLSFGSSGAGRADHLAGELFNRLAGVKMQHVPYKGGAPAMIDLVSGNLQLIFATVSTAITHMKSGRIRTIATTSARRTELMPDVPTVAESGVPGFAVENWYGFVLPAGSPKPIAAQLHREINRILALPELKERLHGLGIVPFPTATPEAFGAYVRSEMKKYAELVKAAGIVAD
jgi:tripartite-type tricarboxylate transporter receptor subunit TctC